MHGRRVDQSSHTKQASGVSPAGMVKEPKEQSGLRTQH